jgi:hypothetical protein
MCILPNMVTVNCIGLTPKFKRFFWWIFALNYVLIDMWTNDQNEMFVFYCKHKILYLTMLIVCRENLSHSDHTNCKIIKIEGKWKVFLVQSPNQFFGEHPIWWGNLRFLVKWYLNFYDTIPFCMNESFSFL